MTESAQIALIASIAPTIAALAGMVVSIFNGRKAKVILDKTEQIHEEQKNSRAPFPPRS